MTRDLPPGPGGILSYFTRHRTLANLLLVLLVAAGLLAAPNMRAQFFPDVIIDEVSVSVNWDGAGAEDVDAAIVQILEPALLAVEGVESAQSTSREGRAAIDLEFEPGWDMSRAGDDVQIGGEPPIPQYRDRSRLGFVTTATPTAPDREYADDRFQDSGIEPGRRTGTTRCSGQKRNQYGNSDHDCASVTETQYAKSIDAGTEPCEIASRL